MQTNVAAKPAAPTRQPVSEKQKKSKPKIKATATHPPVSKMVNRAIANLNERGGSSVIAIKKYVAANFVVDAERVAPFIKKYLAKAVENKILLQTKGKGFTGSFKLAPGKVKKDSITRHVTASGTNQENLESSKRNKKPSKINISLSKSKSIEKKSSKMSTVVVNAHKIKA